MQTAKVWVLDLQNAPGTTSSYGTVLETVCISGVTIRGKGDLISTKGLDSMDIVYFGHLLS